VQQGEPKAADELERLGEPVEVGEVPQRQRIRFIDETEAGKRVGVVGVGGVAPPPWEYEQIRRELVEVLKCGGEEAESPVEATVALVSRPKSSNAALGAVLKDDCFDVPVPGDSDYESHKTYMQRFWRHHAAGTIPRYKEEPALVWTPALQTANFDMYTQHGITPEEVAPERAERYQAFLRERDQEGTGAAPSVAVSRSEMLTGSVAAPGSVRRTGETRDSLGPDEDAASAMSRITSQSALVNVLLDVTKGMSNASSTSSRIP